MQQFLCRALSGGEDHFLSFLENITRAANERDMKWVQELNEEAESMMSDPCFNPSLCYRATLSK